MSGEARAALDRAVADCEAATVRAEPEPFDVAAAMRRRREAALRLPPLACGHRDPLDCGRRS